MKGHRFICTFSAIICMLAVSAPALPEQGASAIEKVRPLDSDIPEGFRYGIVPQPYRATLKENPWTMDQPAIKRLAGLLYPGGDAARIAAMHVSIITREGRPMGDDIMCYVIVYRDMNAAKPELKKIAEFHGYNADRTILLTKDNIAVFFIVKVVERYHYIRALADTVQERLNNL